MQWNCTVVCSYRHLASYALGIFISLGYYFTYFYCIWILHEINEEDDDNVLIRLICSKL